MAEERYIVTATLDGKTQRKEFDNIDGNRYDAMRSRFGENMRIDRLSEMKEGDPIYSDKPYIVTATLDGKTQSREFMGSELTEDMQRRLASRFGENWSISRPEEVEAQESYMVTGGGRSQLWDKSRFDRSYEDYKALHPEASYQRSIMFRDKQDDASRLLESSRALADARAANDDFILEYEENRKALDTAMRTGAASPYESYISENRERYAVAKGEISRLEKELHSNPLWQERRESMAAGLGEMNAAVRRETEEYIAAHPDEERELLESAVSMNAYSPLPNDPVSLTGRKVTGSVALLYKDERDKYIAARRLMDDSVRLFNAPSRYGTENGFMNYLKGMGDTFSDIDFWTRGLTSIADNMQLYDVLSSFQDKFGKVDAGTITEQQLDGMFSPAEKALLNAFATNALVQSERASDLSLGYQAGQGAAESLGYMAEFILTGGVGKAAASPVKTALTRWLARGLTKMTAGAGKTAAEVAGKYGIGLLTDAVKTAAMTGVMPSTYDNIASSLVEVTEEGKLPEANKAIGTAVVDSMIEQGGEIRGSKAFGALTQKITGKLGSMMPDELIRILKNNGVTRFLKEGGYDGFPEEMIEEWWSAALRSVTIDPDALKDFATVDSQLVMAASFIPITLMGGVASGGQRLHLRRRFENSERKLRDVMRNSGYADDQADYMVSVLRNASPQTISDRLTPVIVRMASESTAGQAKDLFGAAADFAEASMRFRTSEALHSEKDAEARDIELDAILRQTGGAEFWMNTPLKNGMNSREVHEAIVHSGETYFILDASVESESGPVEIPAMDEHGNKRFLRDEDISLMLTPMPLESWLSDRIMRRRHEAETERMSRDEASQVQALRGEAWPGREINIGTEEVPVHAVVVPEQTTADDFVLVQTDDGATRSLSWQEFGSAIGSPVRVYTDAETESREADLIDEDRSAREKVLAEEAARLIPDTGAGNAGEGLIEEAADIASGEEAPADATGTADIPLKEDGTVDETSLWNQNPEQWALWNDGQRNDGGRDSDMYIANAIGTLNADIAGLESAYAKEPDMDARQSIRSEIEAKGRRLSELQNIAVHRNAVREGFPKPIAANGETADGMAGGDADVPAAAIPADENGRPQYHLAPVESSLADIYSQGLTQDEIDGFIDANIAESEKELEKLSRKAPRIGTDIQAYRRAKTEYENAIASVQARIDYWNQLKSAIESVFSQFPPVYSAEDFADGSAFDLTPQTPEELAASVLSREGIRINISSFDRETGFGTGERVRFPGMFVRRGGLTIDQIADMVESLDGELTGLTADAALPGNSAGILDAGDPMAAKNAVINLFSEVRSRSDINRYILRNRQESAQRESEAAYNDYAYAFEQEYGMTPEEYAVYREVAVRDIILHGAAGQSEINSIFAEENANASGNERRTNERTEGTTAAAGDSGQIQRPDEGTDNGSGGRGQRILHQAQADNGGGLDVRDNRAEADGDADIQDGPAQEAAGGSGRRIASDLSNNESGDDLPGGTEAPVQGLESHTRDEIKDIVREYVSSIISESGLDAEVVDIEIHGSRNRGDAKEDSDLDVVVEYHGKSREDDMFNALNDETNPLEIEGVRIDINPIRPEETGDMASYMSRSREYDEGKMQTGAPAVYSDSSSDTGTLKTNAGVHLSDFAKGVADEVYSKLPDNLKGRVSVRSSSDGNESGQSFIQRYDIDGKPSKVYFISLFGTDITTNPNYFAIEGYNVDNQEQWYEYSRLFDEYMKSYPDVRAFDHDEAGALFDRFEDALDFSKFAEKRMSDADIRLKHAEGALSGENFTDEEKEIISKALTDGTYMKAPNGADSKLSVKQWVQVRTKAFKEWFGDWEKAARIEKLRKSAPVEMTGEEYIGKYELNRDSAKKWIKDNLRGEYKNRDTGELIEIRKDGAQKVTSHSMGNEAHLKSLAAIPQMIENAIFIDELPNEKGNGKYDSYRYYVCGLKIGGADYTAKITVGVKGASKFYDHALTEIEKGTLIDNIDALSTTFDKNQNTLSSGIKDSKLLSLLQTNSSKVVDENGEPEVALGDTQFRRTDKYPNPQTYRLDDNNCSYYVRFADNIEADLARGWSSWGYGEETFSGTKENLLEALESARGRNFWISGFDLWIDEDARIEDDGEFVSVNGDRIGELRPDEWALVDDFNSRGGLSAHLVPSGLGIDTLDGLVNYIEENRNKYDGYGDGESMPVSDELKVIYSGEYEGRKWYILEDGINENNDIRYRRANDAASEFSRKYNLNASDVADYADAMARGNLNGAGRAFHEIRRKIHLDNAGISLGEFTKIFTPIKKELYKDFGDIDELRQQYAQRILDERNAMEMARRRAEEAAEVERRRLQEFQNMSDEQLDSEYMKAIEAGNEDRMRDLVNEAARRNGYGDVTSEYQGVGAWSAPSNPGYASAEERRNALQDSGTDINVSDIAAGYSSQPDDYFTNLRAYGNDTPHGRESADAINDAIENLRNGHSPMIKVYRAVPKSVKEGKMRNGDWVTPSRKYAQMHGENRLEGDYRIIEQEVPADHLWWDGNDINEWGYDDGGSYAYRNTRNNRKLNDLITRDDKGNIIPLSKRFNARKADTRFRRAYHGSGADFDGFDLSHVGEGHGGQTHGYGVYVTEDNGAAKYFARASLPMGYTVNKIINDLSIEALKAGNGNKESALAYLQSRMTGYSERKMARAAMRVIESGRFLDEGVGRTFIYEVEIPDDTGENYLDWNGSAEGVIDRMDISPEEYEANDLTTGGDIYRYLASKLGGNREASEYLSAKGLVGIRYVSEEAERDNANNYVIFNDDDVQITDRTRFRFLGEKGAARLDATEEATTRLDNLRVAREMENAEKDARSIKLATGWERGADGKWRYETPDFEYYPQGDARKNINYQKSDWYKELVRLSDKIFDGERLTENELSRFDELASRDRELKDRDKNIDRVYLDDYVKDDELFKAYPELKQTRIYYVNILDEQYSAKYNGNENSITVNQAKSIDDKSAIAHEIQHAIQDIEGFVRGSSPDNYRDAATSENVIADIVDATDGKLLEEGGFDNTPQGIFNALDRKTTYGTIFRDYGNALDAVAEKYGYETIFDLVNDIDKFKSSVQMYRAVSGEVEARNVEHRMNLSPEERRQSLASETEDVAREDQIILMDAADGTSALVAARHDIEEVNRKFNEQLEQQINGTLPEGHIYQLGMPSDILLSTGIPNLPVELSSTRLAEKAGQRNHELTISDVAGLPEAMQNPIAVFSYGNKGKAQNIIVEIERDGKNFIVGLHLNQRRQGIEVNSIRGIFPKENAKWLNWVTQGKLLYADKEKIQTLIDKQQTNLADVEYLDLDSVANLLNSFENPKLPARNTVHAVTEAIREDSRIRQDNSQVRQPMQGTTESIRETCDSVAASLGVDVNYVTRDEMPRDSNGVQQRDAKGYQRGGRIYVCLENHSSEEDAAMTVMHEAVGHKGLRALVGPQNMDRFCMAVFRAATPEVRDEIFALSYKYDMHIGEAVEEYLAGLAEKGEFTQDERSFFRKVIDALMDLLERLGIHFNHPFSVADAKWLLWQSYHALEGNDIFIQARRAAIARRLGFSPVQNARKIDIDSRMRRSESDLASINSAAESYANATTDVLNRLKETYVDQYTPLESLIKAVSDASGHPAEIWEDPMQSVYRISSVNQAEKTEFMTSFMQPMWTAVKKLSEKTDKGIDGIARYVMLKHGLERNDKFARRDAREHYRAEYAKTVSEARKKYTGAELDAALAEAEIARNGNLSAVDAGVDRVYLKNRETDYSGLMNMFSDYNWNGGSAERLPKESREQYNRRCREARRPKYESLAEAEAAAKSEIEGLEDRAATECTVLWEKIRAATGYILQHQYRAGMLSKESYDRISSMFEYYVPLRGFEDDTAEDLYQYYNRNASSDFTPPLAKAKGRKSVADNPFSQIGVLAESSIQQDNNNKAKLALYYFVSNRPDNGLVSASKAWYEFDGVDANGEKIWKEVYPDFSEVSEDGAPKATAEILADFESRMRMMQESGAARQGRNKLDVSDRVVHVGNRSRQEHMIPVMVNGEKVNIIVQGNPRAAQAMNGLLNPDSRRDFLDRSIGIVTRFMANNFTSRNPEFWISNLQRDLLFSYMNVSIKEGGEYARRYRRNLSGGFRAVVYSMRHGSGNLGDSGLERMYREFVENGGVTGYTRLASAEEYENMMSKYLKNEERGKLARGIHTAFDKLRLFSEGIENVARFTAYLTSRESGKGIAASIMDAKNITVNFNRKGSVSPISWEESGNLMIRGRKLNWAERAIAVTLSSAAPYLKAGVAFFNAAIQALSVQVDIARRNPTKFAAWMSGYFALGMLNAMLHAMLDDDDDYLDMPDWERRNNILLGGNGVYLKWALPQESRPFYAMGDIIVNWSLGRMKHQNVFLEATKSFAEIAPPVMPTAAQPAIEIALNRDYMGSPIYRDMPWDESNPSYQRVYRNTNEILVSFSELLNTVSGGDYATPGAIGNNVFSNPAVWQHFIDGVGGGTAQFINKVGNIPFRMWDTFVDGEEWNWRTTPLANRIVISNDDRTRNSYLNEVYWYYKDISDSVVDRERKYKKEHDTERILDLRNSPEYDIMLVFKKYESVLEHYDGLLKEETDEYRRKEILRDKDDYVLRPMTDELLSADR